MTAQVGKLLKDLVELVGIAAHPHVDTAKVIETAFGHNAQIGHNNRSVVQNLYKNICAIQETTARDYCLFSLVTHSAIPGRLYTSLRKCRKLARRNRPADYLLFEDLCDRVDGTPFENTERRFHFLSSESVFVVAEGVMLPEYTVAVIFSCSNSGCSRFTFPQITQLTVTKLSIEVPG